MANERASEPTRSERADEAASESGVGGTSEGQSPRSHDAAWRTSARVSPRDRSAPTKRRARARSGNSEGQRPRSHDAAWRTSARVSPRDRSEPTSGERERGGGTLKGKAPGVMMRHGERARE